MKRNYTPVKTHSTLKISMILFSTLFLIIVLLINILASQNISPLYFGFISEGRPQVVQAIRAMRPLPEFAKVLSMQKNVYGNELEDEVNYELKNRTIIINQLENLLQKNPESRDLLHELSLLYTQNGEKDRSVEYFNRAKAVDPALTN